MSEETHNSNANGQAGYERSDLGVAGIVYFLLGIGVATIIVQFVLVGFFHFLNKRETAHEPAVSPLATSVPTDTRKLGPQYESDEESPDYQKYLEKNFPAPRLEISERNELTKDRLREEQTLATYGWVDEKAGTVRIPIDRAMDLIVARGLPVLPQAGPATQNERARKKGPKQ